MFNRRGRTFALQVEEFRSFDGGAGFGVFNAAG